MPSIFNEAIQWLDRAEQAREVAGQLSDPPPGKRCWSLQTASIGSPEPPLTPPCSGEGSWPRKAMKKPDDLSEAFLSQTLCSVKKSGSPQRASKPGPVDDRLRLHDFRFQAGDECSDLTALWLRHIKLVHGRS
jgi:hypothetical protein